jgi:hypothetical protein
MLFVFDGKQRLGDSGCTAHACFSYLGMADHTKNCQWVDAELIQGLYDAHIT